MTVDDDRQVLYAQRLRGARFLEQGCPGTPSTSGGRARHERTNDGDAAAGVDLLRQLAGCGAARRLSGCGSGDERAGVAAAAVYLPAVRGPAQPPARPGDRMKRAAAIAAVLALAAAGVAAAVTWEPPAPDCAVLLEQAEHTSDTAVLLEEAGCVDPARPTAEPAS